VTKIEKMGSEDTAAKGDIVAGSGPTTASEDSVTFGAVVFIGSLTNE